MRKLRIFVYTDHNIMPLRKKYGYWVEFITAPLGKMLWEDYLGGKYRIPVGIDNYTKSVWDKHGTDVDGVCFIPSNWENGRKRILGKHPAFKSNKYEVMIVKHRAGYEKTFGHELKHTLDNLIADYLNTTAERILGIRDFDDEVVHHPLYWYDFGYQMDILWPYIEQVIKQRRIYKKLTVIGKILVDIQIAINNRDRKECILEPEPLNKIYLASKASLGKDASPRDLVPDGLGCAESLTTLLRNIIPNFRIVTGTWSLWDLLRAHKSFKEVTDPQPGDIILCVTGTGNGKVSNGHTGVVMLEDKIASNDSQDGLWEENYTIESWKKYYTIKGGYKTRYYRYNK